MPIAGQCAYLPGSTGRKSRWTPAADSRAMSSMTLRRTPVSSKAYTTSRDSRTALATSYGYWASSLCRDGSLSAGVAPQPLHVCLITGPLRGDYRRRLSQRKRQVSKLGRHRRGFGLTQAGSAVQKRRRLLLAQYIHIDVGTKVCHRLPGCGNEHPCGTANRKEGQDRIGIVDIIEHQEAVVPVNFELLPYRPASVGCVPPITRIRQPLRRLLQRQGQSAGSHCSRH